VWLPVALKASGIGGAMLLLAGVGAASMATPSQGAPITSTAPLVGTSPVADRAAASAERTAPSNGVEQEPAHAEEPEAPKREEADRRTGSGITSDGRVILNIANAEELTRLPGVGKKRAEAIVELRTRLKRFRRPTDLLRVKGIGKKTLAKMLPHLVVDAEDPSAAPK
jgi:competence protein ComEA